MRRHAGQMDQVIDFVTVPTAKSSSGEDIEGSPVLYRRTYARITPAGGAPESFQADRFNVRTKYNVVCDYIAGLEENMEIIWGERRLNILSIPDVGPRPALLKILAEEQR